MKFILWEKHKIHSSDRNNITTLFRNVHKYINLEFFTKCKTNFYKTYESLILINISRNGSTQEILSFLKGVSRSMEWQQSNKILFIDSMPWYSIKRYKVLSLCKKIGVQLLIEKNQQFLGFYENTTIYKKKIQEPPFEANRMFFLVNSYHNRLELNMIKLLGFKMAELVNIWRSK